MNAREIYAAGSPPRLPTNPTTGEIDESEVPLDEVQTRFFLLREDGGVGCRFCLDFHTKEQNRPLYPLRDHVHSVHYNIFPYRCNDCAFKTSSYRLSFAHAEAAGHRRAIVQRPPTHQSQNSRHAESAVDSTSGKKRRKSNPLGANSRAAAKLVEDDLEFEAEADENATVGPVCDRVPPTSDDAAVSPMVDQDSGVTSYVVPSFLPTPPLTPRIQKEYFRYDIEGFLQCSKCEFRVQSASTDGPGAKKALLEHVYATHIENLPWTCRDCQFTTKFKSNLVRHCRKLKHAANEERHAPPGIQEPDTRVVAASAKRVKWAGVNLAKSEHQQANNSEDEESPSEHGYSMPTITPTLRLSWQRQANEEDGCPKRKFNPYIHRQEISYESGACAEKEREGKPESSIRLTWTGQSVEPVSLSSVSSSCRKRKSSHRIRDERGDDSVNEDDNDNEAPGDSPDNEKAEAEASLSSSSSKPEDEKEGRQSAAPDSRLSAEALREKYVLPVEAEAGARCAICDFVIRKTPRVSDPLALMLSHVCGHLALVLRITCIACGFMTDSAAKWESHRSESELDGGPLAAHEPSFAVAVDPK